ncbi:hypothetical protein [Acidithiobacillus sp.]|uniref:hypothetical protein n=1 Tax=Acidithiobacillus sp. TaxID=1872118 RepID=UPI003D088A5D
MKKMIFVHGDKGGVGKSTFASLLADYYLHQDKPVAIIEGDKMVRDVAPRFENVEKATVVEIDLARPDMSEDAVVALFSAMENHLTETEIAIINTPAASSATLDRQADIIAPTVKEMGYDLVVCWMVDVGVDSVIMADKSALCKMADQKVAVQNTRLKSVEALPWHRHAVREKWLSEGGMEIVLPGLTERVISRVRDIPAPFSQIVLDRENGLTIVERQSLKRWVESAWAEIAKMEDTTNE